MGQPSAGAAGRRRGRRWGRALAGAATGERGGLWLRRVLGWVVGGWGTWRRGLVVGVAGGGSGRRRERPTAGSIGVSLPAVGAASGGRRWSLCRWAVDGGGGRPQLLVGCGASEGASERRRLAAAGVRVGGRWVGWLAATQGDYAPRLWERGIPPSYKRV